MDIYYVDTITDMNYGYFYGHEVHKCCYRYELLRCCYRHELNRYCYRHG